jgi:peptidoglycan/xylan/chitin deacetylase (PgdA/CDA1 family)
VVSKTPDINDRPAHTASGEPIIYFTFDDGPAEDTQAVLDVLAEHRAKATFFVVGARVVEKPDLLRAAAEDGHYIGNHTYTHPHLAGFTQAAFDDELNKTAAVVQQTAGDLFTQDGRMHLMRPPYGSVDDNTAPWARQLGYDMVLWDIDPNDWDMPGIQAIVSKVLADAKPGAIVLLHDGGGDRSQTVAALHQILPSLAAQGYTFPSLYLGW